MNTLFTIAGIVIGIALLLLLVMALFTLWTSRKVEAVLPPKGRFVEVPGARLHVREFGEQRGDLPAILMIHGLAGQLSHFTYGVTKQLEDRYRIVVVDRPGSGYSTRDEGTSADLSVQAGALAALARKLGLGKTFVVGHSLGGAVALTLAVEHPEQVAGLALLAPVTHAPDDAPGVFKGLTIESPFVRKLVAWTLAIPASIRNSKRTLDVIFGPEAVPKDFATRGGGLLSLRPRAFLAASNDLQAVPVSLPQVEKRYPELKLPLSVLFGRDDRILDWKANGQALVDKVPGSRLELIEGGHMLPVTQPELCARFIDEAAQAAQAAGSTGASAAAG